MRTTLHLCSLLLPDSYLQSNQEENLQAIAPDELCKFCSPQALKPTQTIKFLEDIWGPVMKKHAVKCLDQNLNSEKETPRSL